MLYHVLFEIWQAFQQWKNFENQLRFDEIIVTSGWHIFRHSVEPAKAAWCRQQKKEFEQSLLNKLSEATHIPLHQTPTFTSQHADTSSS